MKKYNHLFYIAGLITVCFVMLFSCKKDNSNIVYSQRAPSQNLFLSITGTGNLNRTQQISMLSTAAGSASVGLNLTRTATTDITANISVDTAKVKTYNAAYNTQFHLLPATSYDIKSSAASLTIKAGSLFSADSVKISFKNLTGLRGSNYLLPVTITKVSGNTSVIVSDSVKTVYLNVKLTDVTQPTISLTTAGGTTTNLTYPVGTKGATTTTPVTIQLSAASPNTITVNTVVDTSLVSKYGGGLTQFPASSYILSTSNSIVTAGQLKATVNISIPDLSKFDYTKSYLLPVSLGKISGDDFVLKGDNRTVYIKLNFSNLNNTNNTSAAGTSLIGKQGWNVTATSTFDGTPYGGTNYPASNVIDNNNATDAVVDQAGGSITLDMGSSHNVKTISYNEAYSNILIQYGLNTYPSYVNLYTSTDGINWASQGQYKPLSGQGGSAAAPIVNYINFFNAISTRYVRLEIPSYTGFSEVNIYQ